MYTHPTNDPTYLAHSATVAVQDIASHSLPSYTHYDVLKCAYDTLRYKRLLSDKLACQPERLAYKI